MLSSSPRHFSGARRSVGSSSWRTNVDTAAILADLVKIFGHEVEVVHDGPSDIRTARASQPEVVLCDIGLPGDERVGGGQGAPRSRRAADATHRPDGVQPALTA